MSFPEAQKAVTTATKDQFPKSSELKEPLGPHSVRGLRANALSLVSYVKIPVRPWGLQWEGRLGRGIDLVLLLVNRCSPEGILD